MTTPSSKGDGIAREKGARPAFSVTQQHLSQQIHLILLIAGSRNTSNIIYNTFMGHKFFRKLISVHFFKGE